MSEFVLGENMSKWEKFKEIQITEYLWMDDIIGACKLGLFVYICVSCILALIH